MDDKKESMRCFSQAVHFNTTDADEQSTLFFKLSILWKT